MPGETLSVTSAGLFSAAHADTSSPPVSSHSPLPPVPSDFPRSKLIPGTRFVIDGFRLSGDFSVSYFLSHFHSDHYAGLSAAWSRGIVFCSDITARLLQQVLGVSPRFVVRLPLNEVVLVDGCEITLIDANHCPGAVQFLFKIPGEDGKSARYVHTGDFRFTDSMKLEPGLSEFVGCDSVYLDTTYCDPKFLFPPQKESIDYVVGVIDRVGTENKNLNKSVLFLVATYVIGKEKILVEISRRCGRKIHVDSKKMAVLRALGYEDDTVFTEDQSATDVRVVGWNVLGETWPYFRPNFTSMEGIMVESGYSKVVGFVPTGWTYEVKKNKFAVRTKDMCETHLVPYSEHSNFNELREFVRFLRPKRVIPTVGSDIENVDSKHAAKMKKHFAGLVDELANKKEFLMGFERAVLEKGERVVDDDAISGASIGAQQEAKVGHPDVQQCNENDIEPLTSASASAPTSDGLNSSSLLSEKEKEDLIQELQLCLPNWVTQDLMHQLLRVAGTNVVEAVSYFYEHETEFHERADLSIDSLLPSQPDSKDDDSAAVPSLDLPERNLTNMVDITQSPSTKFPKLKPSVGSEISPGKRRRSRNDKAKKKTKINSNPEPGGRKQSSITNFFTKVTPSQGVNPGTVTDKSCNIKVVIPCDAEISYKQELEQLIQIIGDSKSLRNYAATIIEKARGDVNVALDMYYNGSKIELDDDQVNMDQERNSKQTEVGNQESSPASDGKVAVEIGKSSHGATTSKNVNDITMPPDSYSPREHACWSYGQPAPYIHLARAFELVEGEKGKIKATAMLCNMLRSLLALSPEDVLPAVYLCTNKIAPDHENMELNIGGSLVTGALEEVCGTNKSKIKEMYNSLGDLGDVAQECRQTQSLLIPPSPLLIRDVYSTLRKISLQTGNGSTARKKSLIVGLMRSCREKEIKFLVRTLVKNLRIGAMMRTILPALAQAVAMNSLPTSYTDGTVKNLKEKLQSLSTSAVESFNLLPSLDVLVPSLMSKGIEFSSNTLTMVPGIPIRPMLAKITNGVTQVVKLFKNKAFTCEHKYDGQRAQIHKLADGSVRIFSRMGDETTSKFPDVVHIIQDECKPSTISFILDAEVVAIDRKKGYKLLSFQELSSRERGGKDSSVSTVNIMVDVCVYVFDVMFIDGKQLLSCPLRQRRTYFKHLFNDEKPGYLEYAKEITVEADDAGEESEATLSKINGFFEDAFHSSCEGIMAKTLDIDAGYFPSKRADSWLKVKRDYVDGLNDSLDLVPIGAWHGNGRKAGCPFLVACYNPDTEEFESVCRVMSGFSDSFYIEMKEFLSGEKILTKKPVYYRTLETADMWFSPELVWQIRGADFTISPVHQAGVGLVHPARGISVRFPRFVHAVTDRRPEDCSTSADIAEMFHSQKRKMEVGVGVKDKKR